MGSRARLAAALVLLVSLTSACSYRVRSTVVAPGPVTTRILAADGSTLALLHAERDRTPVPLDDVPLDLRHAVVAIEDHRFWQHFGVDVRGLLRAVTRNAEAGHVVEGGSTITQQYVKNTLTGNDESLRRKLQEAVLAVELERRLSKEQILTRYLNEIYLGNGAYGVAAAARLYFQTTVDRLDLAQSALLAGMIRAPEYYNPLEHPDRARDRRSTVLARMIDLGLVPATRGYLASLAPLGVHPPRDHWRAPYAVAAVTKFVLGDERFGATRAERRRALYEGGLRITTTIDPRLQDAAEAAVDAVIGDGADTPSAAVAVVEPRRGDVRAIVGGRDFYGAQPWSKFDLATQGRRQAGSAFKPFALVAALRAGASRAGLLPGPAERTFELPAGPWHVANYGKESFGLISVEDATVKSVNTAFAELVMRTGPDDVVDVAHRLGVRSTLHAYPSAVLGTNEVTPLDMASAYATLAGDGVRPPVHLVERVTDRTGHVVYENRQRASRVLSPDVSRRATAVLRQVVERGTGRGAAIGRPAAGKTGTAQDYRDAWFVGYTPRLAAAVWVGFPDAARAMTPPTTPIRVTGGSWPAAIWSRFMRTALAPLPPVAFPDAPPPRPVAPPPPLPAPAPAPPSRAG